MNEIAKEKVWSLRECGEVPGEFIAAVEREFGLGAICAKLLYCRGCRTVEAARRFLCFEDILFHSPFLLRDIDLAVARIRRAVESREKIVIYGDYDVDGVTSIGLLYLYLKRLGAEVDYYIPSRSGEGYGLSCAAIGRLAAKGVTCIVTVDTGVTACEEADYPPGNFRDLDRKDYHDLRSRNG